MLTLLLSLLILISSGDDKVDELVIHIVGHTHDDPGWLITADEYYVQEVQWIFYTIIPILKQNTERKFTYVEMAYMHRWWEEIDDKLRNDTIYLLNNGQLQMNLGGWCMSDEANPTTSSIIHQLTDGNQFILNQFGSNNVIRPKVAWQIDPFGHSWITAGLFAQSGFDTFGVNRINYLNLEARKLSRDLEFIWNGSSSLGDDGLIFCHILNDGYGSPPSIQFWRNSPPWVQTDPLLPSWPVNIEEIADTFIAEAWERSLNYKHNQILIPFGSDFAHQNAYQSYLQMDKLINYINTNSDSYNAKILYSTLYDYTVAVNQLNLTWNIEQPDFFHYESEPHQFWSGYFTSRPILKLYVRSRENDLRVAEQYYLYAKSLKLNVDFVNGMKNISFLRDAIDVTQHHDAITGTEKDFVAQEYMDQLRNGTIRMDHWVNSVVGNFFKKNINAKEPELQRGGLSELLPALSKGNYVPMVIYNSLPWTVTQILELPSNRSDLVIYDTDSKLLQTQINMNANQSMLYRYSAKYTLFLYAAMKPLSFQTVFIGVDPNNAVIGKITKMKEIGKDIKIGKGGYYSLVFDNTTNRLSQIINNNLSQTFNVKNEFAQYQSSGGLYGDGLPNSGAYIFRPSQDNRYRLNVNDHHERNVQTNLVFREPKPLKTPNFGFIVTPHCGRDVDTETFVASICDINVGNNSFIFNYDVVNGLVDGWYQRPYIDFAVFDTNDDEYGHGVFNQTFTGIETVNAPSNGNDDYVMVTVDFTDYKFQSTPQLLLSPRKTNCNDIGQYIATITDITMTKAVVYIKRVEDGGSKWVNNIYLDYVVYDPSTRKSNEIQINKEFIISIPDNERRIVHPFLIEMKNERDTFIPDEAVVLLSIQQMDPVINDESDIRYYGFTTYLVTNDSFILNLYPFNGDDRNDAKNITLKITYWAFERHTLRYKVAENDDDIINTLIEGPLISEMQQVFKANYAQTYRVHNVMDMDLAYINNRIHIGPIDEGFEFITNYKTSINNNYEFYTNQNGLEYVKRRYETWRDERIAGNYYPSTGQTYIDDIDKNVRFSTIVNSGHGVGCIKLGEYEIMLQRRCLADDHKGVNEVLNTTSHTEPQIMILMDNKQNTANLNRKLYQIQQFSHTYFFGKNIINSMEDWTDTYNTTWTAMSDKYAQNGIPTQLFLMQFRYGFNGNNKIILQIQHMFEKYESLLFSNNVTIDINNIFNLDILNIRNSTETTLTANYPLKELKRLSWNVVDSDNKIRRIHDKYSQEKRRKKQIQNDKNPVINVAPRQIRTFVIN